MGNIKNDFADQSASDTKTTDFQSVIGRLGKLSQAYTKGLETGEWQVALDEIQATYARHRPEENEFYPEKEGKRNIREIIHSFTQMKVAETKPEAALEMLKNQYDQGSTPEIITQIGRSHALNGQNTPHIPLKAAQALKHVYDAARSDRYPSRKLVMQNAQWQITKLASRLIKGNVMKKLEEMKLTSTFSDSAENGRKTDRAAAMTVPTIIGALETMHDGASKLMRLNALTIPVKELESMEDGGSKLVLKHKKAEIPGLDYRVRIEEALHRMNQAANPQLKTRTSAANRTQATAPDAPIIEQMVIPDRKEAHDNASPVIAPGDLAMQ